VDFLEGKGQSQIVKQQIKDMSLADQHSPWGKLASAFRANNSRVINQMPVEASKRLQAKGRIQHADPIGEMIHISAFERLFKPIKIETSGADYKPDNLVAAIPFIAASYWHKAHNLDSPWKPPLIDTIFSWKRIYMVDWDGNPFDPENPDHCRRVFDVLPAPDKIGVYEMPPEMKNFVIPRKATAAAAVVPFPPIDPPLLPPDVRSAG
jgi:hypothetical protein